MKSTFAIASACVVLFGGLARADFVPPPYETHAISSNGSVVVRVAPGKWTKDGKRNPKDQVSIYVYDEKTDSYSRTANFDLGDLHPSERLYVSDDAKFVGLVNIRGSDGNALALRIYSADGKLRAKCLLSDLLKDDEIEASALTGSTIQWVHGANFDKDGFTVYGPALYIRGWGSSYTVIRGAKEDVSFSRTLDLKTMEVKKR